MGSINCKSFKSSDTANGNKTSCAGGGTNFKEIYNLWPPMKVKLMNYNKIYLAVCVSGAGIL